MRYAGKGVVAASAGAVLLLAGGGTMAYWGDEDAVDGGTFSSGQISLVTTDGNGNPIGCGDWMLDDGEDVPEVYDAGDKIVPGDLLTRECEFRIVAEGQHLRASVDIGDPNFTPTSGTFETALTPTVSALEILGSPVTSITDQNDGDILTVTVTVDFDYGLVADNDTQNAVTVLDDLAIVTTQLHS